jgi:hypothetical protein
MKASIGYGALLGIVFFALDLLNNPIAWAAYWAAQAIFLLVFTRVVWERTRLLLITASGADAALVSAALVPASLAGYTLRNLPSPWMTIFWVDAAALVLLHCLSWLVYREEFRRWKAHIEPLSLRDLLMFRHIPILR